MAIVKVQPDKQYLISEERIRFSAPADIAPQLIPFHAFKTIEKSKDIFEKHRGWRFLDTVPSRKLFPGGKPCCTQILERKPGQPLTIKFMPSDYQGDTDDAHNFGELSNPEHRLTAENTIDWVAIMHFWVPAIVVNLDEQREYAQALNAEKGFMPWESMPTDGWSVLRKRFNRDNNS